MGEHMLAFGRTPGGHAPSGAGWWSWLSGQPVPDLNMAGIFGGPTAPAALAEATAAVTAAGVPALLVLEDADALAADIEAAGYSVVGAMPLMVCPASAVPDPADATDVAPMAEEAEMDEAAALMADAFSLPLASIRAIIDDRWLDPASSTKVWLARRSGVAVGAGMSVEAGSNVGIYTMSTPAANERTGVGRSVLAAIHRHARDIGADDLLLGATEAGFPLYQRVGYETVADVAIAVAGASTQFPGH